MTIERPKNENPFVGEGFRYWKNKKALHDHAGGINSPHNKDRKSCEDLLDLNQPITTIFHKHKDQTRNQYQKRLEASINYARFHLLQGLSFHGHDESEESKNRGNFIELLKWLGDINEEMKAVILYNALGNEKMIAPDIEKDISNAFSFEIISSIIKEIGDGLFSLLVDESCDISSKEKMAIVLRYVKDGCVIEHFVGIKHVSYTTALSLKLQSMNFFETWIKHFQGARSRLRRGKQYASAYSVHSFAHQFQLAVVAVAKKHTYVEDLFLLVTNIVTVVGGSAKRPDMIREKQVILVYEAIDRGEISTGQGLIQETNLKRAGDTRWSSHQNTLISMTNMFVVVVDVLDTLAHDSDKKFEARVLRDSIHTYNFVFILHLMKNIMGIMADLSQALHRKDQDIVNECHETGYHMQATIAEDGCESLLLQVSFFLRETRN
ncbi:zinc finger MYM-type protein 1-like [Papaver somniferum]|uniref:zinc finger MYM-type protein 1-like n=1 Tax=Papaver somniferum TaxID=3469 RepID=UPI000E6F67AC|nr:zinc finger MYM-type protein 1-like [Papaver somniferum]